MSKKLLTNELIDFFYFKKKLVMEFIRNTGCERIISFVYQFLFKVDNLPYWVLLYFLLRCGDVDSAITTTNTLGPGKLHFLPFVFITSSLCPAL